MNPLLMGGLMQSERKLYIDVLRSIAILFMIEVHTSAQLAPSNIAKDSFLAIIVASIGGLAAPLFITISGWGAQFSLSKKKYESESRNSILRWVIIRFSFLMICQLIVNIIARHVFNWYTPGILSLLAFCTLLSIPLGKLSIKLKIIIFSILCITPMINSQIFDMNGNWSFLTSVNNPIEWCERIFFNGTYPLFPWAAFFVLGGIITDSKEKLRIKLGGLGVILSISLIIYSIVTKIEWAATQGDALLTFFPASIAFITTASTTVLLFFIILEKFDSKLKDIRFIEGFIKTGNLSLSIYLIHFIPLRIIDELNFNEWNLTEAVIITLFFTFMWWPLSIIHHRWARKWSFETLLKYILAKKNIPSTSVRES